MKNLCALMLIVCVLFACNGDKKENVQAPEVVNEIAYQSFGKEISADDALAAASMADHYESMNVGDTVNSKMIAKVDEVCQAKGCWMKLSLDNGEQVMVKFKDYGFFMPKDIAGKEVIVNGSAFVDQMSVEDQRHFAEDAGKSPEEIAEITAPKKTFSFEADGVLLKDE